MYCEVYLFVCVLSFPLLTIVNRLKRQDLCDVKAHRLPDL